MIDENGWPTMTRVVRLHGPHDGATALALLLVLGQAVPFMAWLLN